MPVPPAISAPKNLMRMNATAKMSKKMSVDMADAELKLPWRMSSTTSWEMVAVGELEEPEIIITGRSYMRRASRVRNKIATISAGLTSEIGRASCRERVELSVGAGSVRKKEEVRRGRGERGMVEDRE